MKKLMNRKILAGILASGALLASGAASAVVCTSVTTLGAWAGLGAAGCTDADSDSTWINTNTSASITAAGLTFSENDVFGTDTYTTHIDFSAFNNGAGFFGSGTLNYKVNPILPTNEVFSTASLDTTRGTNLGTSTVKDITNGSGAWTLVSTDGGSIGPVAIGGQNIVVAESFTTTGSGVLTGATNTYTVTVPEPGSILLLGIGLTGLVYGRRKMTHSD